MQTDPPANPSRSPRGPITFACQECGRTIRFPYTSRGRVEVCLHCGEYVDVPDASTTSGLPEAPPSDGDPPCPCVGAASFHDAGDAECQAGDCVGSPTGNGVFLADDASAADAPFPSNRRIWLEIAAVLCLAVVPPLVWSTAHCAGWAQPPTSFHYDEAALVVMNLQVAVPLLLIIALTGEPWARFGIVRFSWLTDVGGGVLIWLCGFTIYYVVAMYLAHTWDLSRSAYDATRLVPPEGFLSVGLVIISSLTNGFAEELVLRGFLLPRFERALHSTGLAIVATAVLFAAYHGYQGVFGVVHAATLGLVYGIAFCLHRRLWPVAIAHMIADATAILSR